MAKRTQEQQDREEAVSMVALWMGASDQREDVHKFVGGGYVGLAALAIDAVNVLEEIVGFKVFEEEQANWISTVEAIGKRIVAFIVERGDTPERDEMVHIVKDSIDYF